MEDSMPQDEYFEWEDIVLYKAPVEFTEIGQESRRTLEYRQTFTQSFEDDDSESGSEDFQWSESGSTASSTTSVQTTFTLSTFKSSEKTESPINFPSYDEIDIGLCGPCKATPIVEAFSLLETSAAVQDVDDDAITDVEEPSTKETRDCSSICLQPCRNVNYLLHDWREEDVSGSWRHLVTKSKTWGDISKLDHSSWKRHNNVARLENASWRTWSKLRFGLKTVSPETINWMKHCDDTCLYGPFQVSQTAFPLSQVQSRDVRTPNSKSKPRVTKSIMKKPSMAEVLRRGSLPSFSVATNTRANRIVTVTVQGRPLCDSSPLTQSHISHQHLEFSTPIPTLAPTQSKKCVKFLEEVRQYTIVNPVGDRKIHRTIKKTRSTTLNSESYFLEPTPAPEPTHWSPDSLWSYNTESRPKPTDTTEWTWLGVVGEEDEQTDYFNGKHIHAPTLTPTFQSPPLTSTTTKPIAIGAGSLTHFYSGMHHPASTADEVEDELDYLLGSRDQLKLGSYSPESQSSQSSEESSDDELPPVRDEIARSADIVDQKCTRGGPVLGIGIVDDEKHALYEQVMEEFNLVLECA